jgi:hypothetical protein
MKDHGYSLLSRSADETTSPHKKRPSVSFGMRTTQVHTFKATDIVETVHLTTQVPRSRSEGDGDDDLLTSATPRTAHFILSFAMESSPVPEYIPDRLKSLKPKSGIYKHADSSEDLENSEPAPVPILILPDTAVIAPNKLKVMFEIPEVSDAVIPKDIEVCYSLEESQEHFFTANATLRNDRIYQFILELEVDSDVVKSVEEGLREENDEEYDSLDSSAYYAQKTPLKWKGLLYFKVPVLNDMAWYLYRKSLID